MMKRLYIFYLLPALVFPVAIFAQSGYNTLIYEGNKAFSSKNYDRAAGKFSDAAKQKPNDFAAHYNLGNSFYQKKMYTEANAEYSKAAKMARTKDDKMAALYNIGNTYMQTKDNAKAADFYKQALKQDPYNEFARKNYQIAMLQDKEKKQDQSGKGGGGKDGKDPQQQNNDKGKGRQPNGKGNQQKGQGNQGETPNQNNNPGNTGGMPKEQQQALMRRAEDRERETAKRILNKNGFSTPMSNEKDW